MSKKEDEFPVIVTCHSCGYKWSSYGLLNQVSCPNCGRKTLRMSSKYNNNVKDMNDIPYNLVLATKEQLLDMLKGLGIITFNDYQIHKKYSEDLILQIERWRKEEIETTKKRKELKKELEDWQKKNVEDNKLIALLNEEIKQLKIEIEELHKKNK